MPVFPLAYVPDDFTILANGKDPKGIGWGAPRNAGYPNHAAVDLLAPAGTPVRAVDWGVVMEYAETGFYLNSGVIGITHPMFVARYAEIKPRKDLRIGSSVKEGEIIGEIVAVNNQSRSQMLHFEMFDNIVSGSLSNPSNQPYQRRSDVIDPLPFLRAWADELKVDQADIAELTANAPATLPWKGSLATLRTIDEARQAAREAKFTEHKVKVKSRLLPLPEFVYHPRLGKLPNPNRERTETSEYWSRPVGKGVAIVRITQAMGRWAIFKEWVLASQWERYLKAGTDRVNVAIYDEDGKLVTVAAVEVL